MSDVVRTADERAAYPSEYDRRQAELAARYHVVREGMMWHVKCGTGTGSLMTFLSKREAERCAAVLLTAFRDGMYMVESQLRGVAAIVIYFGVVSILSVGLILIEESDFQHSTVRWASC